MRHGRIFDCPNKFCAALFRGRDLVSSARFVLLTPLGLFRFTSLLLLPSLGSSFLFPKGGSSEIFVRRIPL
ncbi:hypothetical protein CEXT_416571 [Caerostris extrusa]|uniref:Uncharacterized protein n=1 Tax=Caerostris extrusa TaxID=172846 RepID=A0AAV4XZB0_CAEEX|nr:hypothetical protein CEXT_416571 [Caerostris extrusa]